MFDSLECITGINKEVLAPILITIFIFFMGEAFKYGGRSFRVWKKRKNYRNIFKQLLISISGDVLSQANGFQNLSQSLNIDNDEDFQMFSGTIGHLETFLLIPFSDFYEAFFIGPAKNRISLSNFNMAFKNVRAVSEIQNDLPRIKDLFQEKYLAYQTKWGDDVTAFSSFLEKVIHNPEIQANFPEQTTALDQIYASYQIHDNRFRQNVIVETLVLPIQQYLRGNDVTPFSLEMLKLGNSVVHNRDNLDAFFKAYAHEFGVYEDVYRRAYRHLSSLNM
ncbi:hypothetical protein EV198_1419 [Roseivirga ehrenbergii]|uniref:Uncharacterized protein n=1 Tax=Roseivirga ehrenbergii (strain DSM 102268 / JCM 13514 / KCTC 12282 / NCIMB 14502 / KMM 6017) TaxID=279360 RepID=A0A150XIU8_ROSEK|nr:hypothetical protein [Roseivirga ehrenbergii]KYG78636.1 hypothetical protein MB14_18065 [Roseivirga ehrenbergii]TCL10389.1 hypothetical protein EV198_1419 [Roseivirga ehrenbergii]